MRLLLLVNSSASSVTARVRVVIQKALSADHDIEVAETNRRAHAVQLARGAAADGVDVVLALGGDGTLNEAANGLVGTGTALAALPGGSTNVFARAIGLPNDPVEATAVLLDALSRRALHRVGLGSVGGRYFLFHTGLGFDAAVVAQVERRAELKRWAGHPLFLWAAVTTWARHYDHDRPRLAVRSEEEGWSVDDARFVIVLNTDPYTFLGNRPLSLVPGCDLTTPLAVVALRTLDLAPLLTLGARALSSRPLSARHGAVVRHGVRSLSVEGFGPFPWQVDGDHLGDATSLALRWEPDVLDVVLPYGPRPPQPLRSR